MPLTRKQKMLLHKVPRDLGIPDADRKTIQRTVGGFHSAADPAASHAGFAAVMAFYESRSPGKRLAGYTAGFWAAQTAKAGSSHGDTSRLLWRISKEAKSLGWTPQQVDALLESAHCSSGQYRRVGDAPVYWLRKLLQALIEIVRRQHHRSAG